jgi:hypothetical protein
MYVNRISVIIFDILAIENIILSYCEIEDELVLSIYILFSYSTNVTADPNLIII